MTSKRIGRVFCLVLILMMLFSATAAPVLAATVNAKITGTFCYEAARSELDMINSFRTGSEAWYWNSDDTTKTQYAPGQLGTLKLDAKLEKIAMERARELAVYYSHTRPDGTSCFTLTADGVGSYGENIAYGFNSAADVFTAWREDDDPYDGQGHRRNMLNEGYTAVGFGCFYHQGIYYWAQEFGYSYSGSAPASTSDTTVTGYVPYSTDFLGEDYWSDEGNCKMKDYTPPAQVEGDWEYGVVSGEAVVLGYTGSSTSITIPSKLGGYPVKKIGNEAFEYSSVRSVKFPSGLEVIGENAFFASDLAGTVTIPASVKEIGVYAFSYTWNVTAYAVDSGNAYYCSYYDALYSKDMSTLWNYPLAKTAKTYVVPEATTLLYCTSFASAQNLQNLYVLSKNARAMTYTFYNDSFNVWCWPESYLYYTLENHNLDTNVVLHAMDDSIHVSNETATTLSAPKLVSAVSVSGGVKVTWNAVSGSPNYRIYRKTAGETYKAIGYSTGTSYTDTNVTVGTKYTYTVRCASADGKTLLSGYDSTGKTATYVVNLAAPKLVSAATVSGGVKVTWNAVTGSPNYRIYRKTAGETYKAIGYSTGTSYTDTNVTAGTKYTYTVRCASADGKTLLSGYDSTGKTATYVVNLAAPKLVSAATVSGGVKVTWNAVSGSPSYRIYRKTAGETYKAIGHATGTSFTDTSVTAGTTYVYTVRCETSDGKTLLSGYDSTGKTATYVVDLAAPKLVSAATVSGGVKVTWNAVSGSPSYRIYRKTAGETYKAIGHATGTSFTDTSVTAGTTYVYTVRCETSDGKTLLSGYDGTGKTATYVVDLPAPVLKAAETVSGGVKVTWNAVSGSPSYRIYRKTAGETYKAIGHATGTSFTDTSVTAGTTYVYTVRCETADGKALLSGYDSAGKSVQYVG